MKKNKFKVGDLVELSSAGAGNNGNFLCRGGYGMVTEILDWGAKYPIVCNWPNKQHNNKEHRFKEYELKRLKVKK